MKRAMKPVTRKFRRHYGVSAKKLTVRSRQPWYWQAGMATVLILLGYFIGYWQFTSGKLASFVDNAERMTMENKHLQARVIQAERQLQVEQAAQSNLAKELRNLQDESFKLKQDVMFYKNMVGEKKRK